MIVLLFAILLTSVCAQPTINAIGRDLGVQIRKTTLMRSDLGKDHSGRDVLYTVLMGSPAVLAAVDVQTGEIVLNRSLTGVSGAWGVKVSRDGSVYLGGFNNGFLYRYVPETDTLTNLGRPFSTNDSVLYPMDVARDNRVYGGTYPSGNLYSYTPATNHFQNLGQMTSITGNEKWIRVTVYDEEKHRLFMGIGNKPQIVEYNITTGQKRELLPAKYSNITAIYDLNYAKGRLFCRKETNNPYEYFVLDAETGADIPVYNSDTRQYQSVFMSGSRGMGPLSPDGRKFYYCDMNRYLTEYNLDTNSIRSMGVRFGTAITGSGFVQLDDPDYPGWTLVGTIGNGGTVFHFNLQTYRSRLIYPSYPAEPVNIHNITTGPDGKIYTAGFLAGNMGMYDPATDTTTHLSGTGQAEGMTVVRNKVYLGVYPTARVWEYDTTVPWTPGGPGTVNPRQIFTMETNSSIPGYTDQDRPWAMAGDDATGLLFVGTMPKNGMLGGALAIYNTLTGGAPQIYWNIIPDQSIVSLAYKDGYLYGGSSINGGMGSEPVATRSRFFIYNVATRQIEQSIQAQAGAPAVTGLHVGSDGNIWGFMGRTLFQFDPVQRQMLHSQVAFSGAGGASREAKLITGTDGNIYGTAAGRFFKVDINTRQISVIATGATMLTADHNGRFYLYGSPITNLFQVTIPELVIGPPAQVGDWQIY